MQELRIAVFVSLLLDGTSPREQALLTSLREQLRTAPPKSRVDVELEGEVFSIFTIEHTNTIYFHCRPDGSLPAPLAVLTPSRVVLTGSHHFNFPEEGEYEGGGRVRWELERLNQFSSGHPTLPVYTWHVTIEARTVEEADAQLQRIRTGEAILLTRYVNHLPASTMPWVSPERPMGGGRDGYGPDGLYDEVDDDEPVRVLPA
jgi:hypothetical protein